MEHKHNLNKSLKTDAHILFQGQSWVTFGELTLGSLYSVSVAVEGCDACRVTVSASVLLKGEESRSGSSICGRGGGKLQLEHFVCGVGGQAGLGNLQFRELGKLQ